MRKMLTWSGLVTGTLLLMSSFIKISNDENFIVDTQRSNIEWIGKKVTGQHNGTIKLASGQLIVDKNTIKGGFFNINMSSITCSDLEGEWNKKMIDHLKADDFFSVDKHPTSKFAVTQINSVGANRINVTGNLTIKNITHPITFAANVKKAGKELEAIAKNVKVDRTKYEIKYGSKSFFASLGDKAIDDEFVLNINLIAVKH